MPVCDIADSKAESWLLKACAQRTVLLSSKFFARRDDFMPRRGLPVCDSTDPKAEC
jgi:hypothetical protein